MIKNFGFCGGLNENGPSRLIGSGTVNRYGHAGVDVTSLEECVTGGGLRGFKCSSQTQGHSLFLLPANPDIEFLDPCPAPCLPAHCYTSLHDDHGLNH